LYSLEHGIPIIASRWSQLKLGHLLRGDRDFRLYHSLFRATPPGYVGSGPRLWPRISASHEVDEPQNLHEAPIDRDSPDVVVFRGERDHFGSLSGWDAVLLQELRAMTRERWLNRADVIGPVAVGVHVRRGDFVEAKSAEDFIFKGAIRTPMEWFVESLTLIRQICGCAVPAIVVSDAPDSALADLLRLDAVTRVDTGSAIGDLLVLTRARLLIASGGSSFSAWAAFLGQMTTVAYPGQSLTWFQIAPMLGQYLDAWDHHSQVPRLLMEQIRALQRPAAVIGSRT
jgi:hypothetical protein